MSSTNGSSDTLKNYKTTDMHTTLSYEDEKRYKGQIPARSVWKSIVSSQIETGTPYMLYKDACNRKSNQQNLGTIKCSNL